MKFIPGVFFLLITCFTTFPTSAVQACGDAGFDWKKTTEQPNNEHCASTSDICQDTHPNEDCPPDTDGCGHCHCPGCGTVTIANAGFFKNTLDYISTLSRLYSDRAANFCYIAPSTSVHLAALFRPPIGPLA